MEVREMTNQSNTSNDKQLSLQDIIREIEQKVGRWRLYLSR